MVNKVILIGNVGADPEIHVFESGNKIARLRVATTEKIYNPATNIWSDHTEWHSVVANQRHSNFIEMYVKKGGQVYVEGRLRRREWGDGDEKRYFVEIRADEFRLLGRKSDNEQLSSGSNQQNYGSQQYGQQPSQQTNETPAYSKQEPAAKQTTYNQQPSQPQQSYSQPQNYEQTTDNSSDNITDDLPF